MVNIYLIRREVEFVLERVAEVIAQLHLLVRVGFSDGTVSGWSKWLTIPSASYGEVMGHGPFPVRDVRYVEINCIEAKKVGRLIPQREICRSKELEAALVESGISFEKCENVYRVEPM